MKKLKVIPLFAVAVAGALAFGPVAFALDASSPAPSASSDASNAAPAGGPPSGGGHRHGERLQKLAEELGLTDAQKEQLKPIFKSEFEQMKALKDDTTTDPAAKKEKMKTIHQSTMEQIKGILTPEQLEKMKEMHKDRHEHAGGGAPLTTGTSAPVTTGTSQ
jgi:protein CpxP